VQIKSLEVIAHHRYEHQRSMSNNSRQQETNHESMGDDGQHIISITLDKKATSGSIQRTLLLQEQQVH
jgi:hypothetical protein